MTNTTESVHRDLEALKARFLKRLPDMSGAISRHWASLSAKRSTEAEEQLIEQAHKLAGAAGIFGLHELSLQGSVIEDALRHEPGNPSADDLLAVEKAVLRITTLTDELSPRKG